MGNWVAHTQEEIDTEREKYLNLSPKEKRRYCIGYNPVTLPEVKTWAQYFDDNIPNTRRVHPSKYRYRPNHVINDVVSIWQGDITLLEVDAIVNSAANPSKGGEVNKAIMNRAGEFYVDECMSIGFGQPGECFVSGGYRLPAKYVINTLAPKSQDSAILLNCYRNSLDAAKTEGIRTIAFPCIATRKKNAFPKRNAAELVLTTVRNWLQNNPDAIDRIIFCLFLTEDLDIYELVMQEFFPIPGETYTRERGNNRPSLYDPEAEAEQTSQHTAHHLSCARSSTSPGSASRFFSSADVGPDDAFDMFDN